MDSISGDEFEVSDEQESSSVQEEKIFVAVRLRPLNEKEIAKGDASDWECINSTTVVFKNNLSERSMYPNAYSFDRVYGCDRATKELYDEGVKGIALSVLNGINSSIFAYGQTSSGKTYTMSGITEFAITDIYDYISKHTEREFVLKFSAIEIYNECVRDLLGTDATPLRLLDDPEKGTVVEKLTEAPLRDCSHLKELIYVCEAERQIGETALNEMSSRSHQILRLAVESTPNETRGDYSGRILTATVNFVDLAGSERASQTLAAGARLKEGCHINRSLLTLGTVIRKLSKGGNGHVPYRNSKLTRILHNSLGGNAKTAILCTICPAHSHLEQSRNTLLFASCAKHVNTNAQVNVVMSDKALVKQLQQELARLEHELRMNPASSNGSKSIIKDMELAIEKMAKEIEDVTQQRDLLQSRLEHLIRVTGIDQSSLPWEDPNELSETGLRDGYPASEGTKSLDDNQHFVDENSPTKISQETTRNTKDTFNKDQHIDKMSSIDDDDDDDDDDIAINPQGKEDQSTIQKTTNTHDNTAMNPDSEEDQHIEKTSSIDENIIANPEGNEKEDQNIEKTSSIDENITENQEGNEKEEQNIQKTSSIDENIIVNPEGNEMEDENIQRTSSIDEKVIVNPEGNEREDEGIEETSSIDNKITAKEARLDGSYGSRKKKTVDIQTNVDHIKPQREEASPCSTDTDNLSDSENIIMTRSKTYSVFTADLISSSPLPPPEKEIMIINEPDQDFSSSTQEGNNKQIITKSRSQPEFTTKIRQHSPTSVDEKGMEQNMKLLVEDDVVSDHFSTPKTPNTLLPLNNSEDASIQEMVKESEAKTKELVAAPNENWSAIFEKQRREIIRLWDACSTPLIHRTYFFLLFKGDQSDSVYMEVELRRLAFLGKSPSSINSARALSRERIMLSKKLLKTFTAMQRDALFQKWGIPLNSKHRRVQLSRLVWTKTNDMDHIKDSAEVVAKLVGIVELNETPKELFGLSFLPNPDDQKTSFWKAASISFI